jgi:acetyl-CoA C-acetyltransferase
MPRVAIVGVAQTRHAERLSETTRELMYQVCRQVLEDVGLDHEELGTVVTSSSDYWQGMGCSNVYYYEGGASYLKDSPKVEGDSAHALAYACMRLLSGHFETALVAAVTKSSEAPSGSALSHISCDPIFQRPIGLDDRSAAALQAREYLRRYGLTEEVLGQVARRNLRNALFNPLAHRRGDFAQADIDASPVIADPLRELHCPPASDGACAVLLASEERARKLTTDPVWVQGFGLSTETYALGERDLLAPTALRQAASRAYAMAGIDDLRHQLSFIELCAPYAHQEPLWYEGLGLCKAGEGAELLGQGVTEMEGPLPVNPSGGVLATNPYMARGLLRIVEAALQLMGKAGARQLPDPKVGLTHGSYGLAGQCHTVIVLGKE